MPPKPATKRAAGSTSDAGPSTKKTRFAESPVKVSTAPTSQLLAENNALSGDAFATQIEDDLEESASKKRRVKTEGYDSDSSDDGEGVVESRKAALRKKEGKAGVDDEDDDLDMFGAAEGGSDAEAVATKKPPTKYMNLGDIEGQEFGRRAEEDDEDEDGDDEPEDEDDAERRAKKGMGFQLSSFNMKEEMEEGKFDEDGTFVRSYDPHQMHDRWMDDVSKRDIKKARRAQRKIEEQEAARIRKAEEEGLAGRSESELQKELLDWVRPGETVLQTLSRLGADKKKNEKDFSRKTKTRPGKAAMDQTGDHDEPLVDQGSLHPSQHPENSAIDRVTALASTLMDMGNLHVYDETHRTLLYNVREAGIVPADWVPPSVEPPPAPPSSSTKYQYRWAPEYLASTPGGASPGDVFGPYGKDELLAWKNASYFGPNGERVQIQKVGDAKWSSDWSIVV